MSWYPSVLNDRVHHHQVARLKITTPTLKRLFSLSGNRCAFPECSEPICDQSGTLFADICHIEAANEGGERYNASMTDEQRRDFANLFLLCKKHHTVTNDVILYPVALLRDMKAQHEAKAASHPSAISNETLEKLLLQIENTGQFNLINGPVNNLTQNQTFNSYYPSAKQAEENRIGVISEIFEHILATHTSGDEGCLSQKSERYPKLLEKIALNFPEAQLPTIKRMLVNTVHYRTVIEGFLQTKSLTSRGSVLALQEIIQSRFCKRLDTFETNTRVGDVKVIEALQLDLLPSDKATIPEYSAAVLAIVLYFFDICDIGQKSTRGAPPSDSAIESGEP